MFKNKKEMWEALLAGNTLIDKTGSILYVDLNSIHGPLVYKEGKITTRASSILEYYESFFIQGMPRPKRGDKVLVWDDNKCDAVERIYLATMPDTPYPFITVISENKERVLKGEIYPVTCFFKHMEPLPQTHTITIDGNEITISEESYAALKESLIKRD